MLCGSFFAEQPTNCRMACTDLGIGMEIDRDVKREKGKGLVRELIEGGKGREMRKKVMEWNKMAEDAAVFQTVHLRRRAMEMLVKEPKDREGWERIGKRKETDVLKNID
ncbi:unnamed protein product [Cuscuta epithymum]|uniref:Uncharacterized protein n=1 Tax=Cuscuta epithymum TaxID=186058 RepID=A0AAV0DZE6_9ASTE|nr:unnamed protein product [Cuscuta epithymum]